jgi:hypothetical protein
VKAARRQNLRLTVIEWPGGEPKTLQLPVSDSVIRRVLRGGNRVPLPGSRPQDRRKLLDLPWCSRLMLAADDTRLAIISGPAQFASAGWFLPIVGPAVRKPTETLESLKSLATQLRSEGGYAPVR